MRDLLWAAVGSVTAGKGLSPRRDGPEHLKYISLEDNTEGAPFFYSNTVDRSCVKGQNAICGKDCGYIKESGDFYSEVKCRFCLIRWKCLDVKPLRICGKALCSDQCDNEEKGPKEYYGLGSSWRSQECLACMLKENCASEYDLKLHYGYTRNCVGECVSRVSDSCPPLPIAERCSYRCHTKCQGKQDGDCLSDCLAEDDCTGMKEPCIDCIESCAATKLIIQESEDRAVFDMPKLKSHFTYDYMKANKLLEEEEEPQTVGRERDEKKGKSKGRKKASRRDKRKNRRKDNKRGWTKKTRKRQKKGKSGFSRRQKD